MPITPQQILQQVATYQSSALAFLENLNCFITTANTKFENFQDITANLGDTVNFDLTYRFNTGTGLVATFQGIDQRLQPLKVDQAGNVPYTVTNQDRLFNLDKDQYMQKIGKAAIKTLAATVESNIALNATSDVPVMQVVGGQSVPTGAYHTESGPFRFYGDGATPINSYQQLAQMIANFKNFGAVSHGIKVYLPDTIVPTVIGSGLAQFVPRRNDDIAMSWEIGEFGTPPVEYYQSNLLPIHNAGNVGNAGTLAGQTLTVISTNDPTGANITQITCSGATANDVNAIKRGDMMRFADGVGVFPNMRFKVFIGGVADSTQPVQMRVTVDAAADGSGNVVLNILPGLTSSIISPITSNIMINNPIQAGMKIIVMPSHRAGLVVGGDALFLAMPKLSDEVPFPTSAEYDEVTGVSMRMYYGSLFAQNQKGIVHDCIWGSTLVPEYSMRILFPLNQ